MESVATASSDLQSARKLQASYAQLQEQIANVIVGQERVIEQVLIALFCRGHCLVQGVPGLAKTLLVSTIAQALDFSFRRIQFTPDLMPSDITGTEVLQDGEANQLSIDNFQLSIVNSETAPQAGTGGRRRFEFQKGPIFAN